MTTYGQQIVNHLTNRRRYRRILAATCFLSLAWTCTPKLPADRMTGWDHAIRFLRGEPGAAYELPEPEGDMVDAAANG